MSATRRRHHHNSGEVPKKNIQDSPKPRHSPFFKWGIGAALTAVAGLVYWYSGDWQSSDRLQSITNAPQSVTQSTSSSPQSFQQCVKELDQYLASDHGAHSAVDQAALDRLGVQSTHALSLQIGLPLNGADETVLFAYLQGAYVAGKRYPDLKFLSDAFGPLQSYAPAIYLALDSAGFQKIDAKPFEKAALTSIQTPIHLINAIRNERVVYFGDDHSSLAIKKEFLRLLPKLRQMGFTDLLVEIDSSLGIAGAHQALAKSIEAHQQDLEATRAFFADARARGLTPNADEQALVDYDQNWISTRKLWSQIWDKAQALGMRVIAADIEDGIIQNGIAPENVTAAKRLVDDNMQKRNAFMAEQTIRVLSDSTRRPIGFFGAAHMEKPEVPAIVLSKAGVDGPSVYFGTEYTYRTNSEPNLPEQIFEYTLDIAGLQGRPITISLPAHSANFDYYYHFPPQSPHPITQLEFENTVDRLQGKAIQATLLPYAWGSSISSNNAPPAARPKPTDGR